MTKISVVIPIYNASSRITRVLNSVVNQTISVFEIILINDCSKDDTFLVLEKYASKYKEFNIKIIDLKENKGVSYCRNLGWNIATGDYIAFMDSDDYWNFKKIELMISVINKCYPDLLGHKYNDREMFLSKEYVFENDRVHSVNFYKLLFRNLFQTSCVLVNRELTERFDETITHSEDYELFLRLSAQKKVVCYYEEELTYLGRPQLSKGGLSEKRIKMRIGEIKAYYSALKIRKALYLIPFMALISMLKYLIKIFRK